MSHRRPAPQIACIPIEKNYLHALVLDGKLTRRGQAFEVADTATMNLISRYVKRLRRNRKTGGLTVEFNVRSQT